LDSVKLEDSYGTLSGKTRSPKTRFGSRIRDGYCYIGSHVTILKSKKGKSNDSMTEGDAQLYPTVMTVAALTPLTSRSGLGYFW
jgi:hypothetical protein